MTRNITLKIDAALLKKCKRLALEKDKSLSQWLNDLILRTLGEDSNYARAKRRALRRLETGWDLGGSPLSREEAHER